MQVLDIDCEVLLRLFSVPQIGLQLLVSVT